MKTPSIRTLARIFLILILAALARPAMADAVTDAFALCSVFDGAGLVTEPCEVSGWGSSVDVRIDTSASEARIMCAQVVDMVHGKGLRFGGTWTLKIRSPYSGDNTIAYCTLR
jgi:hypothetical protein